MDSDTVDRLRKLNNDFYREQSASFAGTRQAPWQGWEQCLAILQEATDWSQHRSLSVFDLACGNLRFEAFLASALPGTDFNFYAVDSCDELLPSALVVDYQHLDVLDALGSARLLGDQFTAPTCDLCVAFGFLHHIPLPEQRAQILSALIDQTHPGGFIIVSLWQFLNDPARHKKAQFTHARALQELSLPELDSGDYLLGWKDTPGAYRYCHSFSDAEIDQLIATTAPRATLTSRFTADGHTGDLNTYLIFQVS